MSDITWVARPAIRLPHPTELPAPMGGREIELRHVTGFTAIQVVARGGRWANISATIDKLLGVKPCRRPTISVGPECMLLWTGADQFAVVSPEDRSDALVRALRERLTGIASLSDQSDGRVLIELSGGSARDALARLVSIDLDDRVFPAFAAAATAIDHVGINIWRAPDRAGGHPVYGLLLPRSFAQSLVDSIIAASKEYGLAIGTTVFTLPPADVRQRSCW